MYSGYFQYSAMSGVSGYGGPPSGNLPKDPDLFQDLNIGSGDYVDHRAYYARIQSGSFSGMKLWFDEVAPTGNPLVKHYVTVWNVNSPATYIGSPGTSTPPELFTGVMLGMSAYYNYQNGLDLSSLGNGDYAGFWVTRAVSNSSGAYSGDASFTGHLGGNSTGDTTFFEKYYVK